MKVTLSDRFKERWDEYLDYGVTNYGMTLANKKNEHLISILKRLELFPESYHIEPLLQDMDKEYRSINFDKMFKIIYTITENEIIIENLWNSKRNPNSLEKDI
jgi:hypothetical protein